MTRGDLIEAIVEALNRSKKKPWLLGARARGHRELKKYGGPQRSRARRNLILKNQDRTQDIRVLLYDPAASSETTPYQARRSVTGSMARMTDDPRKKRILHNIERYGAKEPEDEDLPW